MHPTVRRLKKITDASNRRKRISLVCFLAGGICLLVGCYIATLGAAGGVHIFQGVGASAPLIPLKDNPPLFWFLLKEHIAANPEAAWWVLIEFCTAGALALVAGFLLRPRARSRLTRWIG